MPAQPVIITETEMKALLATGKRPPEYSKTKEGQLVATWAVTKGGVPTGLEVKVYTSIFNGQSRGVGEDSIRVCVVDAEADKGMAKTTWTQRTEGWQTRLVDKLHKMFVFATGVPYCSCGRRMALRENKTSGTRFWGCTGFKTGACKSTKPFIDVLED